MALIINRTGQHRKQAKLPIVPFGQVAAGIILAILTAVLALGAVVIGSTPASAATVAVTGHGHYWYDVETCHDFKLYRAHQRPFAQMVRASQHADTFLLTDVREWNAGRIDHDPAWLLSSDRQNVAYDCSTLNGYGL